MRIVPLLVGLVAVGALACVGAGVWLLSRPVALIVVGGLLWLEVSIYGFLRARRRPKGPSS